MAHNSQRRIAAQTDPKTSMNPSLKKHPKPTPFAASVITSVPEVHHHPIPDPITIPASTVENISYRFSKLYANHKKLGSKSLGHSNPHPHPRPENHFRQKTFTVSPVLDTSCTTLTKSKSHHERNDFPVSKIEGGNHFSSRAKVKEKDKIKNPSNKEQKKPFLVEYDVKKASQFMTRSLERDQVKGFQKGFDGRRLSVSSLPLDNGRRSKSVIGSQIDLSGFFSCAGVRVVAVDMSPSVQIHAVNCARKTHDSLEKFTSKSLAFTLKKEFDEAYGPAWHCIVGTSFGSFVTHSVGGFMYFSMDHKIYILLFKTTVQKQIQIE
ncbi:uncharacterized protein [Primulina huaijiensis]|uniref:uncharacterized protein n=1 Tax=Primulina huaijiensis TaxID=1492673 RepID=UPI003CC797C3